MTLCPARLEPVFSPRPWGARSLAPFFPEKSGLTEPIGEAWMTGNECRFANGPFAGKSLGDAWRHMPPEWAGTHADTSAAFPLLVKFIFPEEKLSVQVHPDDDYAARHEQAVGGRGKTEMWYAVRAKPGAEVLVGLKPEVTRESFARAIADGTAEDCLVHIPVCQGDAIFVPAGTAHTIGPGLVLCEIQQNSDLTYRVYDYNRRDVHGLARDLHVDKALDVIRFGKQLGGKIQAQRFDGGNRIETTLISCPYFAASHMSLTKPVELRNLNGNFSLVIFLEGTGRIRWREGSAAYAPFQVWMIPAKLEMREFVPESPTSLLETSVPAIWKS